METPTLTDGVVVLNALQPADAALMVESHDEDAQWAFGNGPMSLQGARRLIERTRWQWVRNAPIRRFAIRQPDGLSYVGWVLIHPRGDVHLLEIEIHPTYRNAKLGRSAAQLICDFAFRELTAETLEVETRQGHGASQRMAIAVGFEGAVPDTRRSSGVTGYPISVGRLTRKRWESRK